MIEYFEVVNLVKLEPSELKRFKILQSYRSEYGNYESDEICLLKFSISSI